MRNQKVENKKKELSNKLFFNTHCVTFEAYVRHMKSVQLNLILLKLSHRHEHVFFKRRLLLL